MKVLSIIIPLYNSAKWLPKCLDSIFNQDIPIDDLDVICVDDGSPDNSAEIVEQYKKRYNCITIIKQPNKGPSGARNNGIKHAQGKYLCFVDPDDYVEPNVFGSLIQQMDQESLDMLRFNFQTVNEDYVIIPPKKFEEKFNYTAEIMSGAEFIANRLDIACNIWRYIFKTDIILKNNIWCFEGDYYDDTPWLPLVLLKAERLNICDTIVYNYLERADSLVKTTDSHMIQRKIDGCYLLLDLLIREKRDIDQDIDNYCGVIKWYDAMMCHTTITLLTFYALYKYDNYRECIDILKQKHELPLQQKLHHHSFTNVKYFLVTFCPNLYCRLVHWRHSK